MEYNQLFNGSPFPMYLFTFAGADLDMLSYHCNIGLFFLVRNQKQYYKNNPPPPKHHSVRIYFLEGKLKDLGFDWEISNTCWIFSSVLINAVIICSQILLEKNIESFNVLKWAKLFHTKRLPHRGKLPCCPPCPTLIFFKDASSPSLCFISKFLHAHGICGILSLS